MRHLTFTATAAIVVAFTAACQPVPDDSPAASQPTADATPSIAAESPSKSFDAIRADETISFVGTEPFWGGKVGGGQLTYSTPENHDGETIAVRRFAGNNGLGFSGTLERGPFDLTITPGTCSDGMSDRSYPYTATLKLADEQRNGCAWTDRQPFSGPANP